MAKCNPSAAADQRRCSKNHDSLYEDSDEETIDVAARIRLPSSTPGSLYYTRCSESTVDTTFNQNLEQQSMNIAASIPLPNSRSGSLYYSRCSDPSKSALSIDHETTQQHDCHAGTEKEHAWTGYQSRFAPYTSNRNPTGDGSHRLATNEPLNLNPTVLNNETVPQDNPEQNYWQQMEPLFRCLPRLKAIAPSHRRYDGIGLVSCIDYYKGARWSKSYDNFNVREFGNHTELANRIHELRNLRRPNIVSRFVLVEDLCPDLIETLGYTFQIDPDFFAEHLNRSGYASCDYADESPKYWQTRNLSKTYAMMKWYRPILQNPTVTQWLETPGALLDRKKIAKKESSKLVQGSIDWTDHSISSDGTPIRDRKHHQAMVSTNVFRRSWSLSTRPATKEEKQQKQKGPGVRLVFNKKDTKVEVGREDESDYSVSDDYGAPASSWANGTIPTAWEEKASCFRYETEQAPIIVLLLDPLPAITDHQTLLDEPKETKQRQHTRPAKNTEPAKSEPTKIAEPVGMSIPMVPRTPIYLPRNKFHATDEEIQRFRESAGALISTHDAVQEWSGVKRFDKRTAFRAEPILALLQTASLDSEAFFDSLDKTLDEINKDSLDDYEITRQLDNWRQLMSDFEIEIPSIGQSVHEFVHFVFQTNRLEELPPEIVEILTGLDRRIARANTQLETAYAALRADMQFSESRRSIREAQSVGKLTELAFFFIPLSFTCSLFSMSIVELQNGVPVWIFVVTAIIMAFLAYIVRIVVSSDFIKESSRSALEEFWGRRDVRRGQRVPTLTLVLLTIQEVFGKMMRTLKVSGPGFILGCLVFVLASSFVATPLALLWTTTNLDTGFNIAMTLFLISSGLACFLFIGSFQDGISAAFNGLSSRLTRRRHAISSSSTSGTDV